MTDKDITIAGHGSGTPSKKNLYTYSVERYAKKASNGVRKGIVEVRRLKGITEAMRRDFVAAYTTLLGRNKYNQDLRQYVYSKYNGSYYSDCSSSIMATFRKIGRTDLALLTTAGMHSSSAFETVQVNIVNGRIMNPHVLRPGDIILFAGSDPSRPLQIGHVEVVMVTPGYVDTPVKEEKKEEKKDMVTMELDTLCRGCECDDVKVAKLFLNHHGAKLDTTNPYFGDNTTAAVKAFQKAHKLDADGVIGKLTWGKLFEL